MSQPRSRLAHVPRRVTRDRGPQARPGGVRGDRISAARLGRRSPIDLLAPRAVIEQAKGILMATYQCGPDEALDFLRELERNNRGK